MFKFKFKFILQIIVIIFVLMSVFHACMGWKVSYERLPSIFIFSYALVLTFLSFKWLLITAFHVFLGHSLGKLTLTLKVLHLLDQELSSILSRWSHHCSLPPCKHSLMLFNFSLILIFSEEILSSGLTLQVHLTIHTSFLSSLITFSSLTGQVSLPYSITLCTHAEYNLPFASKGKPLLANKGTKYLNLHHPLLKSKSTPL